MQCLDIGDLIFDEMALRTFEKVRPFRRLSTVSGGELPSRGGLQGQNDEEIRQTIVREK